MGFVRTAMEQSLMQECGGDKIEAMMQSIADSPRLWNLGHQIPNLANPDFRGQVSLELPRYGRFPVASSGSC